jgi:hypothetical protein
MLMPTLCGWHIIFIGERIVTHYCRVNSVLKTLKWELNFARSLRRHILHVLLKCLGRHPSRKKDLIEKLEHKFKSNTPSSIEIKDVGEIWRIPEIYSFSKWWQNVEGFFRNASAIAGIIDLRRSRVWTHKQCETTKLDPGAWVGPGRKPKATTYELKD